MSMTREDRIEHIRERYDHERAQRKGQRPGPSYNEVQGHPGRTLAYEYLRELFEDRDFDSMSDAEQRDELLSAMGLMVSWVTDAIPKVRAQGEDFFLMAKATRKMALRFGPWRR